MVIAILSFILGVVSGLIFLHWWTAPDVAELRNEVAMYRRKDAARKQKALQILRETKAARGIDIDGDDG